MVMFVFALVVLTVGTAAYGYYNPGTEDVTLYVYRFDDMPRWSIPAVTGLLMLLFLLFHALFTRYRIARIRTASARAAGGDRRVDEETRRSGREGGAAQPPPLYPPPPPPRSVPPPMVSPMPPSAARAEEGPGRASQGDSGPAPGPERTD